MFMALGLPRVPSDSVDWPISTRVIHDLQGVHSVSFLFSADALDERIKIVRWKKNTVEGQRMKAGMTGTQIARHLEASEKLGIYASPGSVTG